MKRTLRRLGYRLCRIEPDDIQPDPRFDDHDLQQSLQLIKRLTKDGSDSMTWQRSQRYLDSRRVHFYHAALRAIEDTGVLREGARVLDIGVYFGYMLRIFHQFHPTATYYGTETNPTRLAIAKELCPFATLWRGTISDLDDQRSYDLIILTEVLEHLVDPAEALHKLASLSHTLLLTVPDGRRDRTDAMKFNRDWGSYRGHINFWSPESWQYWLEHELPNHRIRTGKLPTSKLYAVVQRPTS